MRQTQGLTPCLCECVCAPVTFIDSICACACIYIYIIICCCVSICKGTRDESNPTSEHACVNVYVCVITLICMLHARVCVVFVVVVLCVKRDKKTDV